MCEIMERYLKEGRLKAQREERIRTIQNMLAKGFSKDVIRSLDYTEEEIEEAEALLSVTI